MCTLIASLQFSTVGVSENALSIAVGVINDTYRLSISIIDLERYERYSLALSIIDVDHVPYYFVCDDRVTTSLNPRGSGEGEGGMEKDEVQYS